MRKIKQTHSIDDVQTTNDLLTGRAGLNLFVRYLWGIDLFPHIERMFGSMRKSGKGVPVVELFKQVLCFLFDGTSRHLNWFDALAKDPSYAVILETAPEHMASSHAVKRFFQAFSLPRIFLFRRLLLQLFLWRLRVTQPKLIELNIDTMVMDNDQAPKRHGVEPTYKNVLGFQPLQMTWGRYIIDAVFRGGSKHSNNGDTVRQMILHVVRLIRKRYSQDIPIIFRMDSGFCDQKLFEEMERLGVGYICAGVFHKDIKAMVDSQPEQGFAHHFGKTDEDVWQYCEFGDRRSAWKIFRRAIFWRPLMEEKQFLLPGSRPGTFVYTNLGMGQTIDRHLEEAGLEYQISAEAVIHSYHQRGADELVHRAFKDFAFEELPFLRFPPNAAFYSMMLLGFFLFEAFNEDVTRPILPVTVYPTTLRRQVVDLAGKIVSHAGKTILKVTATAMTQLRFKDIWDSCLRVPVFRWA